MGYVGKRMPKDVIIHRKLTSAVSQSFVLGNDLDDAKNLDATLCRMCPHTKEGFVMVKAFKHLEPGECIKARLGSMTVVEKIGGGSQGDVYVVEYNGDHKALKWYHSESFQNREGFKANFQNLLIRMVENMDYIK